MKNAPMKNTPTWTVTPFEVDARAMYPDTIRALSDPDVYESLVAAYGGFDNFNQFTYVYSGCMYCGGELRAYPFGSACPDLGCAARVRSRRRTNHVPPDGSMLEYANDDVEAAVSKQMQDALVQMSAATQAGTGKTLVMMAWSQWVSASLQNGRPPKEAIDMADECLDALNERFNVDDAVAATVAVGRKKL